MDSSYWRPRENDVATAYRKAIPNLTVSETEELRDVIERREADYSRKLMESERRRLGMEERLSELIERVKALEQGNQD